ncbi:MAG: hypothetical protein B7X04_03530 [Parcubacteria group bacterium 21-54-25]|nr:MAG: hypothetical protein B7X04_03530 [Parcubacteria group bacterium 21-54-25]HQU08058.1 hypothetical protein [Candidatus Paceibacterota bacterium]
MNPQTLLAPEEILRRAGTIGSYYGFAPFPALALSMRENRPGRQPYPREVRLATLDPVAQVVASFLKQVRDAGLTPSSHQPLFVWHTNITPGRRAPKQVIVQFHVLGGAHAIADAVLVRAMSALITDLLKGEPELRLNSIGDRETRVRFARELAQYFKRRGSVLPADCVASAKRDVFEATESLIARAYTDDLPSSIDHLSEASRKHFENVLEFLEDTETPYALAPELITRGDAWTETCFEIRVGGVRVAWGSRYNELAVPFFRTPLPSIAMVLRLTTHRREVSTVREPGKPRIVFLHIGDEAKRASIRLTEDLRRARLPIAQMIGIESLVDQMLVAERLNPPYFLIMGRKEALDGTAILRERATHIETVLPIESLVENLRTIIERV